MTSDLEDAIARALHAKAGTAPSPALPPLGATPERAPQQRRRLVPIAAAAAVVVAVGVGATLFTLDHRDDASPQPPAATTGTATPPAGPERLAPNEVYYSLHLTVVVNDVVRERQLWQEPERTGRWSQEVTQGLSIDKGRVVPGGGAVGAPDGGVCFPAFAVDAQSCTGPATWFNPTVDFLATAPRDPATIGRELHDLAVATLAASGKTDEGLARLVELKMLGELLTGNGVPADLSSALREVASALPGVTVTENMANLAGERGTGYSLPGVNGGTLSVIFDADDHYLGSPKEAVRHGVAPGLGQPPSRMLD